MGLRPLSRKVANGVNHRARLIPGLKHILMIKKKKPVSASNSTLSRFRPELSSFASSSHLEDPSTWRICVPFACASSNYPFAPIWIHISQQGILSFHPDHVFVKYACADSSSTDNPGPWRVHHTVHNVLLHQYGLRKYAKAVRENNLGRLPTCERRRIESHMRVSWTFVWMVTG